MRLLNDRRMICVRRSASIFSVFFTIHDVKSKKRPLIIAFIRIPGKRPGTLVRCPECNRCAECPFPEYRDQHEPDIISRDVMLESGIEAGDNRMMEQLQAKLEYEDIKKLMDKENPIIAQVFEAKTVDGLSAEEIADTLGIKKRNVYYYLDRARAIGQKYNAE